MTNYKKSQNNGTAKSHLANIPSLRFYLFFFFLFNRIRVLLFDGKARSFDFDNKKDLAYVTITKQQQRGAQLVRANMVDVKIRFAAKSRKSGIDDAEIPRDKGSKARTQASTHTHTHAHPRARREERSERDTAGITNPAPRFIAGFARWP